jgi:hypothetical protein
MAYIGQTLRGAHQPTPVNHMPGDADEQKWSPRGSLLFAVSASLTLWGLMILTTWYFVG